MKYVNNLVSETVKEYMEVNNLSFSLREQAAIVYNSKMFYATKVKLLKEIAEETDDSELNLQINELLDVEEFQINEFYKGGESIFYLLINSETDEYEGCYLNAKHALQEGKELNQRFKIKKYNLKSEKVIKGNGKYGSFEMERDDLPAESWQVFNPKGQMMFFYSEVKNVTDEKMTDILFSEKRFQNAPIYFPNPFRKGDIVQSISENIIGVNETSQETWDEWEKYKDGGLFDYWDYSLIVRPIGEEHNPEGHYHLLPIHLELIKSSGKAENCEQLSLANESMKNETEYDDYNAIIGAILDHEESSKLIYTDMTKKAMNICFEVHKNQIDKSGLPYVFHPFHLAEQMDDECSVTVALLHDVVEDSEMTFEDLNKNFPEEVINPLRLLTHQDGVKYMDYIKQIKEDEIARKVKIADLKHNMNLTRLEEITEKDIERFRKYRKALSILEDSNNNLESE